MHSMSKTKEARPRLILQDKNRNSISAET